MILAKIKRPRYSLKGFNDRKFNDCTDAQIKRIIENDVSEYFEQSLENLRRKGRKRIYCLPRQLIMTLMVHYTDYSYEQIGGIYSKEHHTSVLHAKNAIMDFLECKADTDLKEQLNDFLYKYGYKTKATPVKAPVREIIIDAYY